MNLKIKLKTFQKMRNFCNFNGPGENTVKSRYVDLGDSELNYATLEKKGITLQPKYWHFLFAALPIFLSAV